MIKKWYDSYIIICEFEVFCSGIWILYEAENCTLVISAQQQQLRWYLWVNQYAHIKQTIMKKRTPFNKLTPCNYPSVWINILNEYQRWKQKYHILVNELFSVCFFWAIKMTRKFIQAGNEKNIKHCRYLS